jgi:putative ABC transport system permease protein
MRLSQIAFRNIRRNTRRSLLSGVAISIAALAIVFLFSLIAGMKADFAWNIQSLILGEARIRHEEYTKNELLQPIALSIPNGLELAEKIEALEEVAITAPRVAFPVVNIQEDENRVFFALGMDFQKEKLFQNFEENLVAGSLPEPGSKDAVIGYGFAEENNLSIGDKLTVLISRTKRNSQNSFTFYVSGIISTTVDAYNKEFVYLPIDRAMYYARMGNDVTEILMKFENDERSHVALIESTLAAEGVENAVVEYWREGNAMYPLLEMAEIIYNFIALMFFILASTVIVNTTMMVIFERMKEIGTIGAMGMTGGEIVRLFFLEALFISVIGAFIGVVFGAGITYICSIYPIIDFSAAMEGVSMELSNIIYPILSPRTTVFVFFYAVAVAGIASLIPSRAASKIEPVEALRKGAGV